MDGIGEVGPVTSAISHCDPQEVFVAWEDAQRLHRRMKELLSKMEWTVLWSHVLGDCYEEIARNLGIDNKAVDCALFRAKHKLRNDREIQDWLIGEIGKIGEARKK